jgi:5-methylcytosine-specific restriction enzyme subunit McrC
MKFLTLREWDYLEIGPGERNVTRAEADALVEAASRIRIGGEEGARIFDNGVRRLRAQQVVGTIVAGGIAVEILPKVDGDGDGAGHEGAARGRLVQMLARVIDLDVAEGRLSQFDWQRETLLEVLITLFCDRLFEAVRRGLPRRYVEHEADLPALRGRLRVARQFTTLAASPQAIACRFDELSADTPLNRIMKAAVILLLRFARSARNQKRLRELAFAFADVRTVAPRELDWGSAVIDRTNRTWADLIELARLLLGTRFQTTSRGGAQGFSLLFDMSRLFEEFVGRTLQRSLAGRCDVRLQGPRRFALTDCGSGRPRFATIPDVTLWRGGQATLIIDTKWKRLSAAIEDPRHGVSQSDVYQMMAYAHVYRCDRMMLLYPHHEGLGRPPGLICEHAINGTDGKRISIATLSLSNPRLAGEALDSLMSTADGDRAEAA